MSTFRLLTLLCIAAAFLLLGGCSSPVANGGGTETGNPEVVACAEAAFDAMSTSGRWQVATYVPGGENRLDPSSVSYDAPDYLIAKRLAASIDTAGLVPVYVVDTIFIVDTLPVPDTILEPVTTYVLDTLIRTLAVRDTADSVMNTGRAVIIRTSMKTDSVFVTDTLVGFDTLIAWDTVLVRDTVYRIDTIYVSHGVIAGTPYTAGSRYYTDTASIKVQPAATQLRSAPVFLNTMYNGVNAFPVYVFRDPDGSSTQYSIVPAESYRIDTVTALAAIEKVFNAVSGDRTKEQYADIDGDGFLHTNSIGAGSAMTRYSVLGERAGSIQATTLDFDAGSDGLFTTTANNRIVALQRRTATRDSTQTVSYEGATTSGALRDSMFLTIQTAFTGSAVESLTTVYCVSTGSDTTRRDDRLAGVGVLKKYSTGEIVRIEMMVAMKSRSLGLVTILAVMADGSSGTIAGGVIDLSTGVFTGTYSRNATETKFAYARRR